MVKHTGRVTDVKITHGEYEDIISEIWMTFDINGYEIEAFIGELPSKVPEIGETCIVDLDIMTFDLQKVNVPKKQKLIYQLTTKDYIPDYILVGEVLDIDRKNKRLIFDCGVKLECDIKGINIKYLRN